MERSVGKTISARRVIGPADDNEALRQKEQLLREAEQIAHVGSFSRNLRTDDLTWSDETYRIFGYAPGEVTPSLDLLVSHLHPDDRSAFSAARESLTGEDGYCDIEYRIIRKDGQVRTVHSRMRVEVDGSGRQRRRFGAIQDVTDRQRAEEALQESRAKLESIFESSPNVIVVVDREARVEDCNRAALEIFGLTSKEEILGRSAFEFVAPKHLAAAREMLARTLESGSIRNTELALRRGPGNTFLSEISTSVMRSAAGAALGVVVIAADITERRRADERLRAASNMLDLAPSSITVHDAEGRFLYANHKTFDIHGYEKDEFMALTLHDIDVPESEALIGQRVQMVAAQGEASFEVAHFRKDRSTFPLEVYVKKVTWDGVDAMLSIATDITARKRAEEALRRSEHLLRESQKVANIGHYVFDARTGRWESSEVLDSIFGIHVDFPKDVEGWLRFIHPDDRDEMSAYLSGHVLTEHHPFDREYRIVRWSDGAVRWVWGLGRLEFGPDGEVIHMIGTIQDVTKRKEAEEMLLAYQAKLRSLGSELSLAEERERRRIAGDLHDHACQGLALSKLKLQAILDRALPADMQTLQQICGSLNETIEDIRELTFDLSSPTLYKFGLEAALEELLQDRLRAEHKVRHRFSDDGRPKPLAPDVRVLLFQSVRELLINVIKHAHASKVRLDISRDGDSISVIVADDGVGFDVEEVWLASARRRSVGLFNVHERLDYIGGRLEIDSRPGGGSRFTLTAPLETEAPVAKENHDGSEDSTR